MIDSSIRFAFAGVIGFVSVQLVATLAYHLGPGAFLLTPVLFLVASYWAAARLEEHLPGAVPCLAYSIVLAGTASVLSWDVVMSSPAGVSAGILPWQLTGFTAGGALLARLPSSRDRGLSVRIFLAFVGGGTVSSALSAGAMAALGMPALSAIAVGLVAGLAVTGAAVAEVTEAPAATVKADLGPSLSHG
jgi:hypothetical protein